MSCHERGSEYRINGSICCVPDGDSITLAYSPDGIRLKEITKSVVGNGKFSFVGTIDECKIAYVYSGSIEPLMCPMIFLEKGFIDVIIDTTHCTVSGTLLNDRNNRINDSVAHYLGLLLPIEEQFYNRTLSEEEMRELGAQGYNIQERLIAFIRGVTKENIGNMLGLYMLVAYNDFYTTEELKRLAEKVPASLIDEENNPLYDVLNNIILARGNEERLGY